MESHGDILRDGLASALKALREGRVDKAERLCSELLQSRPDDFASHQLAAAIAMRGARYSEAERWSRSCLRLRPGHAPAMVMAGRAARALGDLERAREWFGRAIEAAPNRPEPAFLLCVTQLECGNSGAQESLARVMTLFPANSEGWSQIGAALRKANQWNAAALAFARAFASSGEIAHAVEQASALMTLGRVEEAVAVLRAALVIAPDKLDAILALAKGLRQLAEYHEALALLERTAALHPDDCRIQFAMGLVCDDLHDSSGAVSAYRRCVALRPGLPEAQVNLGVALQQTGALQAAKDPIVRRSSSRPIRSAESRRRFPRPPKACFGWTSASCDAHLADSVPRRTRNCLR